jgi:hypothetical protein
MVMLTSPAAPMERPGVGIVISSAETPINPARGAVGYVGRARTGPLNTPQRLTSVGALLRRFGSGPFGGDAGNTMDGAAQALLGRATAVEVVRAGSGGTASTLNLMEDDNGPAAIKVDAIGVGVDGDQISIALQGELTDPTRLLIVSQDGLERERIRYTPGSASAEVDNLLAQFGVTGSDLITLTKLETASDASLAELPTTPLSGGTNPTVSLSDLTTALDALSGRPFEVVAFDAVGSDEVDLLVETLNDWITAGKLCMGVVAAQPGLAWTTKLATASGMNNPAVVYVGNGFRSSRSITGQVDNLVEGYAVAGREAGRHAALPLARQLTHAVVTDGISVIDEPPPDLVAEGLQSGVYLYTSNSRGQVWTEQGITSQSLFDTPPPWAQATDGGWGKSRLVLTRFRLLRDIAQAWEPLIETATNNSAGRKSIAKAAQNIIDMSYVPVGAVESGTVIEHPDYAPTLDRATFLIADLLTPDGSEKLVLEARFRR